MKNFAKQLTIACLALWSVPGVARDFCPERPGQTTPPCTVEPGHIVAEVALGDWVLQQDQIRRSETVTLGQFAVRIGVADHTDVAVAWIPFAVLHTHEKNTGRVDRQSGFGDVTLSAKRGFGDADAPVAAIKAFITLPVGRAPSGSGAWNGGVLLPIALNVTKIVQFSVTPEIDALGDSGGTNHHLAYGTAAGIGFKLSDVLSLGTDMRFVHDDDPAGGVNRATVGAALAFQSGPNLQFDAGTTIGVNSAVPDLELYVGVAKRF